MKKTIAFLLAICLLLSTTACAILPEPPRPTHPTEPPETEPPTETSPVTEPEETMPVETVQEPTTESVVEETSGIKVIENAGEDSLLPADRPHLVVHGVVGGIGRCA